MCLNTLKIKFLKYNYHNMVYNMVKLHKLVFFTILFICGEKCILYTKIWKQIILLLKYIDNNII
jgi:hypothetical protein